MAEKARTVPAEVSDGFIYPLFEADQPFWGVYHDQKGQFVVYDVSADSVTSRFSLSRVQQAPHKFQGSFSHVDTLLLLDLDYHRLIKLTPWGDTVSVWQLPYQWNEYGAITFNAFVPTPINYLEGSYFISIRSMEWDFNSPTGGLYQAPLFLRVGGPAPQDHAAVGAWPSYIKDPDHFALDLMPKLSRPRGDTLFYTFYSDPNVYAYAATQQAKWQAHVPANAFTHFAPMKMSMMADVGAASAFGVQNSLYGGLVYDPYRDYLYRIVLHALPLTREDGMENIVEDKPWSLQILDAATLEALGEAELPDAAQYLPRSIYPTAEGLWIQHRSTTQPADGDNRFTLFSLAEK